MVALVDCNNFFASCERVFRPDLENLPVMVLSANDGCVIARSNEVKALGIKMGVPLFQIKDLVNKYKIRCFSTNFALYGELSNRIMQVLARYTPNLEVYSIDEAFLSFDHLPTNDYEKYAREIARAVKVETGVPISIGISVTKTLAKIASKFAKKHPENQGAKYIPLTEIDTYLDSFPLGDIWGVGWQLSKTLPRIGISTPLDLKQADINFIRKKFGVSLQRTVLELNGKSCIGIDIKPVNKKNIIRSRSFGQKITEYKDIENAISTFVSQAGRDLRKRNEVAWLISVFIRTDKFNEEVPQYRNFYTLPFPHATNDTLLLNKIAIQALKKIYQKGFTYKKAGIMLSEVIPETNVQYALTQDLAETNKSKPLMKALDKLNRKYGEHSLHVASEGEKPKWVSRSKLRSPDYLGSWDQIPIVK